MYHVLTKPAACPFGLNLELPTLVSSGTKYEAQLLPFELWNSQVLNLDPEINYPRGFYYFPQSLGENSEVVFQMRPEPPIPHPFQCDIQRTVHRDIFL